MSDQQASNVIIGNSVLVVEDHPIYQRNIVMICKKIGYMQVDLAVNGKQALEKIEKVNYDLIMMDLRMPDMNGFETTKKIRAYEKSNNSKNVVIIAMNSNDKPEDRAKCLSLSMNEYLIKPFNVTNLLATIKNIQDSHSY